MASKTSFRSLLLVLNKNAWKVLELSLAQRDTESVSYQQCHFQEGNRFGTCLGLWGSRWEPEGRGLEGVEEGEAECDEERGVGKGLLFPGT